jgi:single-stranded-DNA-specific exonuclease
VIEPRFTWVYPDRAPLDAGFVAAVAAHGGSARLARVMAARGIGPGEVDRFFGPARDSLHDPALLPDVEVAVGRIGRANVSGEGVLVVGDFDADGLTGLAIMVRALRRVGIDAAWHVPSRLDDGHGLSLRAVELARAGNRGLIITVDMGSSSGAEIAAAGLAGIDVIVTDHHRVPPEMPPAIAVVNPHRPDTAYPDARLTGSGVALKVAALLLERLAGIPVEETTADLADLATIGTVADVAPVLGENRGIARLGLERIRRNPRPGIAALLAAAGVAPGDATLETIGFALAPRLNAAGRVGDADVAAALLLTDDAAEAAIHAAALDAANLVRRDVSRASVDEARAVLEAEGGADGRAILVRGPWPVGIIGLVAGRLAEDAGLPAVVATPVGEHLRASCRAPAGYDLAAALEGCADLLVRHGGHRGAAGFEVEAHNWDALVERLRGLLASSRPADARPRLTLDLALPARSVDYALLRDLDALGPTGPGNPDPVVGVHGLTVTRIRAAAGGHAQLTLRREIDVLDGIAFGRGDLVGTVREGDRVDVAARLMSRRFGGFESLQLGVIDVAPERTAARDPMPVAATAAAVHAGR